MLLALPLEKGVNPNDNFDFTIQKLFDFWTACPKIDAGGGIPRNGHRMSEFDTVLAALSAADRARKETEKARELETKKLRTEWIESADGQSCKHAALQDMLASAKKGECETHLPSKILKLCRSDIFTLKTMFPLTDVTMFDGGEIRLEFGRCKWPF